MAGKFVILTSAIMILAILSPQISTLDMCSRPKTFENDLMLQEYVNCVKSVIFNARYGKRSVPNTLVGKLNPMIHKKYYKSNEDSSILYKILKYKKKHGI